MAVIIGIVIHTFLHTVHYIPAAIRKLCNSEYHVVAYSFMHMTGWMPLYLYLQTLVSVSLLTVYLLEFECG